MAQLVKNLPAMRESWVRSLGGEDFLEKGTAIHFSILAWRIPWNSFFFFFKIFCRLKLATIWKLAVPFPLLVNPAVC